MIFVAIAAAVAGSLQVFKSETNTLEDGGVAGVGVPAPHDHVAIFGLVFDAPRATAGLFGRDQRAVAAGNGIEDDCAALGDVADRVRQHGDGLDRRMHRQLVEPAGPKGVDPRVFPDLGAIDDGFVKATKLDTASEQSA